MCDTAIFVGHLFISANRIFLRTQSIVFVTARLQKSAKLGNFGASHLLHGALGLEEDSPAKELSENATDAPHVHRGGVVSRAHQDFRRAIILCHHFLGHVHVLVGLRHPGQSEITDLRSENAQCALGMAGGVPISRVLNGRVSRDKSFSIVRDIKNGPRVLPLAG